MRYFQSRVFDAGLALVALGAIVVRYGWIHLLRATDSAPMHVINSPSSANAFTFTAEASDPIFVGWGMIVGVLSVLAGLALLTVGVVRVNGRS